MITASIVTYHNSFKDLKLVINCFMNTDLDIMLYISDNSENRYIEELCSDNRIEYIFNNANIGFGAAHNIAIRKAIETNSKYHLISNPDVFFDSSVLKNLIAKMEQDSNIGAIMPKILNLDQSVQLLPKLLPTPFNLLIRVISPIKKIFSQKNSQYILENFQDIELNVPIISGCFCLFNLEIFKEVGYYDDRFFMYFEDFDLSRRIHSKYKTVYCPSVSIIHAHERGASKSYKLFKIFIKSAIVYFNKYGWFFDKERKQINKEVLNQIKRIYLSKTPLVW